MSAQDGNSYSSQTATNSPTFQLEGGSYVIDVVAAWGGGSVTLQRLGPDGATFITAATALSTNGSSGLVTLPAGTYQWAVVTAGGVYASVSRVLGN